MNRFSIAAISLLALGLTACVNDPQVANQAPEGSYAHQAKGSTECTFDPGTCALDAANQRMHADMAVEWTGDPDVDFLRTMIPHHVGAVEMAHAVIKHGHDPVVRELAETIVRTQEEEISQMRAMLEALDTSDPSDRSAKASAPHHH